MKGYLLKIIDFEKRGNVIRFYLGKDNLEEYYGDDWDDTPYEHNADKVYDRFVSGYCDVAFPFDYVVLEPKDDYRFRGNSPWCKYDLAARRCPCIIAVPCEMDDYGYMHTWNIEDNYTKYMADASITKFYFGDEMEPSDHIVVKE